MNTLEKHPMILIVIGIMGISLSSILVKYAQSPSVVTAAYRLLWTVFLMTPAVICSSKRRQELLSIDRRTIFLCILSGIFLEMCIRDRLLRFPGKTQPMKGVKPFLTKNTAN